MYKKKGFTLKWSLILFDNMRIGTPEGQKRDKI